MEYVSVGNLIEDHLTAELVNEFVQSCGKDEGEMRGRESGEPVAGVTYVWRASVHMKCLTKRQRQMIKDSFGILRFFFSHSRLLARCGKPEESRHSLQEPFLRLSQAIITSTLVA